MAPVYMSSIYATSKLQDLHDLLQDEMVTPDRIVQAIQAARPERDAALRHVKEAAAALQNLPILKYNFCAKFHRDDLDRKVRILRCHTHVHNLAQIKLMSLRTRLEEPVVPPAPGGTTPLQNVQLATRAPKVSSPKEEPPTTKAQGTTKVSQPATNVPSAIKTLPATKTLPSTVGPGEANAFSLGQLQERTQEQEKAIGQYVGPS